jgi:ParB-like nuclease domain
MAGRLAAEPVGATEAGGGMSRPWQEYCDQSSWHDAANIFPLMSDDELQKLADDIKANGLKNPIILLEDKVLDGRNRLLACKLAGVSPDFQSRNAEKLGSPVSWVLSQNLHPTAAVNEVAEPPRRGFCLWWPTTPPSCVHRVP